MRRLKIAEKYSVTKHRRDLIISHLGRINFPMGSIEAFNNLVALNGSDVVPYRCWQREISRLISLGKLDVECNGRGQRLTVIIKKVFG